jgi:hypothetical protein
VPYPEKADSQSHGDDPQGLKELKELAVGSPIPPSGFGIKSAADVARKEEEEKLDIRVGALDENQERALGERWRTLL